MRALDRAGGERILALGYNRRFAPMMVRAREHMAGAGEPLTVQMRVNAGPIPLDHWIHDPPWGAGASWARCATSWISPRTSPGPSP